MDAFPRLTLDFPLRSPDAVFRNRARPCIEYQIKRCAAPCCLETDRDEYLANVERAIDLLRGKNQDIARGLEARMRAAAAAERFEEAARLRDQLRAIQTTVERQEVVAHWGRDQDVLGCIGRAASSRCRFCSCAAVS